MYDVITQLKMKKLPDRYHPGGHADRDGFYDDKPLSAEANHFKQSTAAVVSPSLLYGELLVVSCTYWCVLEGSAEVGRALFSARSPFKLQAFGSSWRPSRSFVSPLYNRSVFSLLSRSSALQLRHSHGSHREKEEGCWGGEKVHRGIDARSDVSGAAGNRSVPCL